MSKSSTKPGIGGNAAGLSEFAERVVGAEVGVALAYRAGGDFGLGGAGADTGVVAAAA